MQHLMRAHGEPCNGSVRPQGAGLSRLRSLTAFSLVELVIVIVIIGIVATIAIPRIGGAARGADEAGLRADLAVLRSAIELYAAEHEGNYPAATAAGAGTPAGTEAAFRFQMTLYSDRNGKVSPFRYGAYIYGPYLRKGIPALKVGTNRGSSSIKVVASSPTVDIAGGYGWIYAYQTGRIIANADDPDASGERTYDEY